MAVDFSLKIPVVEGITKEEFTEKYNNSSKPVIIKRFFGDAPAYSKWTMDYFRDELGHIEVGLFDKGEKKIDQSFKHPDVYMKFRDYLDLIEKEPTDLRIFLFNIFKHKPELWDDFEYPEYITDGFLKKFPFLFFGARNSVVRIHQDMDMCNVFLTQFHGRKRVVLFSPDYSDLLYRFPFNVHSAVDVDNPDFNRYPGLKYVKGYSCILEDGDTLFIPSGYWHHIEYLEGGFAMSVRALPPSIKQKYIGARNIVIHTNFDDVMRKFFDKKWFEFKQQMAEKRAQEAIMRIKSEEQQPHAVA